MFSTLLQQSSTYQCSTFGLTPCLPVPVAASGSAKCHLPIEYAADLTPVVEGKEAGASWNARGMEKTVDFWSRKEYSVRASGRTPGKIAGHDQGQARRLDQLVLGETARNQ
jgi:hypothetical protein